MGLATKTRRAGLNFATRRRRLLAAAVAALAGGCVPPRRDRGIPPQPAPPQPAPPQPAPPQPRMLARLYYWDDPNLIRVERGGRLMPVSNGMALFERDFVQTMSSYAQIDFVAGDRVWLDVNTRVQVDSLWLIFGRIFASGSPPFRIETEDVTASPEGTRFGVRQHYPRTGDYAVVVESGRVRCTGRRLNFQYVVQAGTALVATSRVAPAPPGRVDLRREIGWASAAMSHAKPPRLQ
jgi:hypothetical protein